MNTKAFCRNGDFDIKCNPLSIYIKSVRILPVRTECNRQKQCLPENVKIFFESIKDTCNGSYICQLDQYLKDDMLKRSCSILENVKICGK